MIDNPDHSAFAALGVLEDLTDRVKAWGQANAYFDGPWDSTTYQGKNYGIPDNSNCLVLWYNTAFTDPAEIAPPTNWDELKAATALTEGDRFGLAVSGVKSEEGTFQWLPFLWEAGADIPTLNSDGGKAALQLWVDLVKEWLYVARHPWAGRKQDVLAQFQNGKAAMMINGPWQIPTLQKDNPDLKWQVVTLPQGQAGRLDPGRRKYGDRQGRQEYRRRLGSDLLDADAR